MSIYLPVNSPLDKTSINHLNKEIGDNFKFEIIHSQREYQRRIKQGDVGIYYTPPHFAAWLIHQHDFQAILKLDEPLRYIIAARNDDVSVFELSDLSKKNICLKPPLNLDYLFYNKVFTQFISAPHALSVQNAEQELLSDNAQCIAFVINNHSFNRVKKQKPSFAIKLGQSRVFTNYGFLAHPNISSQKVAGLKAKLLSNELLSLLKPLLKTTTSHPKLINAEINDYPRHYLFELNTHWN